MSSSITIKRDEFTKLLGSIKLVENCCTDCDAVGGKIRQKTNDRHCIVEINVSSVLQSNDLCLSLVKQKVQLLKTFELDDNVTVQDANIGIEFNDGDYVFMDPLSKMVFRKPLKKFLDNTFITDEEFTSMIRLSEENLIFSHTISAYMAKRIKNICEGFNNETIQGDLENLEASLKIYTMNKENVATVIQGIALNKQMPKRSFKMIYLPFSMEINSDVVLSAYQVGADVLLCKFEEKFYGIPITIYTQVRLTDDSK